jgi:hypothetical protein
VWRLGDGSFSELDRRGLGPSLANIVSPTPQSFDNLGEDGSGKWHAEEDERFMHEVGQAEL